jgi:hypothetical protein
VQQLTAAAIILFCAVTTGFAGNFTPIPNNKIAQTQSCVDNCLTAFDICVRLRGNSTVGRSCEAEQSFCLMSCQVNPRGG